jgi:hypothetical protein
MRNSIYELNKKNIYDLQLETEEYIVIVMIE